MEAFPRLRTSECGLLESQHWHLNHWRTLVSAQAWGCWNGSEIHHSWARGRSDHLSCGWRIRCVHHKQWIGNGARYHLLWMHNWRLLDPKLWPSHYQCQGSIRFECYDFGLWISDRHEGPVLRVRPLHDIIWRLYCHLWPSILWLQTL